MSKTESDGLSRLQSQSRIPARTWRQWCTVLEVDPSDAVEVWEEICQPIFIATQKLPEVAYILQMRAARLDLDLFDFKEEVPAILHTYAFLFSLKDEHVPESKIKILLLRFYKSLGAETVPEEHTRAFVERFLTSLCSALLVAKVLPGENITLRGVLKPVIDKRGSIEQIVGIGLKSLGKQRYASAVRDCLNSSGAGRVDVDDNPDDDQEKTEDVDVAAGEEANEEDAVAADEEEEDDDEDCDEDDEEDRFDEFLTKFKHALQQIYRVEYEVGAKEVSSEATAALLKHRLKGVSLFKPMGAHIPSMEEAQAIAKRLEVARNARKPRTHTATPGSSGGGPAVTGPGGSGGGSGIAAPPGAPGSTTGMERTSAIIKSEQGGDKKTGANSGFIETGNVDSGVAVSASDVVESGETSLPQLSDRVHEVAGLLSSIESAEQEIWSVYLEPGKDFKNLRTMARTITTSTTGSNKAYSAIKKIAQYHAVGQLLHGQEQRVSKGHNFSIDVTSFINGVANSHKTFEAGDRALGALKKILDHAAVTLVRLEALRTNYNFAEEHPDEYSPEAVTKYYEEALCSITDQINDGDLLGLGRQKADKDTRKLFAHFLAEKFVEELMRVCREYIVDLHTEEHTKTLAGLKEAFAGTPLNFEDMEPPTEPPDQIPAEKLVASGFGDIFDAANTYLATEAWSILSPVHQPDEVILKIRTMLREVLLGSLVFEGENRRHTEKPSVTLAVVSLEKVSENPNLREFYVRVSKNGSLLTVDSFDDGSFLDLFEMREYKPSRVHAAAKKKAEAEGTEVLQTGRKYLFTVGRTNKLFCASPSELLNGCVRADGGGPKVFKVFK